MNVAAMLRWPVTATVRCISTASSTHPFLNHQGRKILGNDGCLKAANFFNLFAVQLDRGVTWIDSGLKSACHHYDPDSGAGIWLWPSAADKCGQFFEKALALWRTKKHDQAMFYLGAAVHLVQDLCVPHHAACRLFNGHVDFEDWAERQKTRYQAEDSGLYEVSDRPEQWVAENARLAKDYLSMVESNSGDSFHQAARVLLPRAQKTTAGFLMLFYSRL